jgi:hypothetical protein
MHSLPFGQTPYLRLFKQSVKTNVVNKPPEPPPKAVRTTSQPENLALVNALRPRRLRIGLRYLGD